MFNRFVSKCVTGLVLLFAASHCQAQHAPNEYASWKGCKVGTTVKFQASVSSHPSYVGYFTTKLVKIEGDDLFIEETVYEPGQEPKVRKVSPPAKHPAATKESRQVLEEHDEQLEVVGHKMKAHITKSSRNGRVSTIAVSDEIPGGFCSITEVSNEDGVDRTMKLTPVEITRP
jgi:hypothetical protein